MNKKIGVGIVSVLVLVIAVTAVMRAREDSQMPKLLESCNIVIFLGY